MRLLEATMDYWDYHGWAFLLGCAAFPRFTTLFFASTPFGVGSWIAWLFVPHLLVAYLATQFFWDTNPGLCVLAWIIGVSATFGESKGASRAIAPKS